MLTSDSVEITEHQSAQRTLWAEQRRLGHRWLVTDLVTAGCPLAHAQLLVATDHADLLARQNSRELPTCPPTPDRKRGKDPDRQRISYDADLLGATGRVNRDVLHHAAVFGPTRWTNLYFPAKWGLFGDPVGGTLANVFGLGIADRRVTSTKKWRRNTPKAHSDYWRATLSTVTQTDDQREHDALTVLRQAVDLDCTVWLGPLVAELPLSLALRYPGVASLR